MAGGGQDKWLQSLLQASRCRLPGVRRGQASAEAERSCDSTPLQLRRTVYVLQAAVLHAGHQGFFFFGPTAIIKIGNREETGSCGFSSLLPHRDRTRGFFLYRHLTALGRQYTREGGHSKQRIPFWPALHYLLLAFLLVEGMMQLRDHFLYCFPAYTQVSAMQ